MADRVYHVLFLCTGNSARSIRAEALLTLHGQGRFRALESLGLLAIQHEVEEIGKRSMTEPAS